jgi:MarR family transcriptional regulator for hemolysin
VSADPVAPVAPALDDRIAHRLGVAGRVLRGWADAELAELGVGAPAAAMLLRLAEGEGLTQVELARLQRVEAPTVCRMLDRLARQGLVERRPDPADRRAMRVHLTEAGQETAAGAAAVLDVIEARLLEGLDAGEREALGRLLGLVFARIPSAGLAER